MPDNTMTFDLPEPLCMRTEMYLVETGDMPLLELRFRESRGFA